MTHARSTCSSSAPGPVGLYGAYYAGVRGLSVAVVDSLSRGRRPGHRDVPREADLRRRRLPRGLRPRPGARPRRAGVAARPDVPARPGGPAARAPRRRPASGSPPATAEVTAGAVVVTGGIGTFTPRPLPAGEEFLGRGLEYFVPSSQEYVGRDVVIVGGGDSAIDWALMLEPLAASVTLVHRREAFRAHAAQRRARCARSTSRWSPTPRSPRSRATTSWSGRWSPSRARTSRGSCACDKVVAALGFTANLGPLREWGLELARQPAPRRRHRHAHQPPGRLRGRRHHRLRRQGAADLGRLRRGRHRGEQRRGAPRPGRARVPRPLHRRRRTTYPSPPDARPEEKRATDALRDRQRAAST